MPGPDISQINVLLWRLVLEIYLEKKFQWPE